MRLFQSWAIALAAASFCVNAPLAADDLPNELAAQDDAILLQPLSPWNLDFGTNRCRLGRMFGTEGDRHLLMFEQAAPSEEFGITFAGAKLSNFRNGRRIYLGMEADEAAERLENFARADIPDIGPAIILTTQSIGASIPEDAMRAAGIDLNAATKVEQVVLKRGSRVLSFETGDMMPAFQALNTCTSDLLRDWGLDPELHQAYSLPKWTNEAAIVRRIVDNYPRSALNAGEEAIFRMRVIIETDGSVSDCLMENSTEIERLESPACQAMMNARFDPARDANGNPMRSFYASTVTYRIN